MVFWQHEICRGICFGQSYGEKSGYWEKSKNYRCDKGWFEAEENLHHIYIKSKIMNERTGFTGRRSDLQSSPAAFFPVQVFRFGWEAAR